MKKLFDEIKEKADRTIRETNKLIRELHNIEARCYEEFDEETGKESKDYDERENR